MGCIMDDLLQLKHALWDRVEKMKIERDGLKEKAVVKAGAWRKYYREMAKTILQLEQGVFTGSIDGVRISGKITTHKREIAQGIIADTIEARDISEALYESQRKVIDALDKEISSIQSLLKRLDEG